MRERPEYAIIITGEETGLDLWGFWEAGMTFHDESPTQPIFTGYKQVDGQRKEDLTFSAFVRGVVWGNIAETEMPAEEDGITVWAHLDIEGLRADMVEVQLDCSMQGFVFLDEDNVPKSWLS